MYTGTSGALTFQSQVSLTSGKSRWSWYQSKRFVSRQTKYYIARATPFIFSRSTFACPSPTLSPRARARARFPPRRGERCRCCFLCRSSAACSLVSASGRSGKTHTSSWIRAERCGKREQPCFISRLQTSSSPRGYERRCTSKRARLSGIPEGVWGCGDDRSSSSSNGSSPRRIYTGYSPGQWSFRKPLIGPAARIVRE